MPFNKLNAWMQHIIPRGVYRSPPIQIDTNNSTLVVHSSESVGFKYMYASGKVIEEQQLITLPLPTVSKGSLASFTVVAYSILGTTTRSSESKYMIVEGFLSDENMDILTYQDLGLLEAEYEFLVIGHMQWLSGSDPDDWYWIVQPTELSVIDAAKAVEKKIPPFHYHLSSSTDLTLVVNDFGPVYETSGAQIQIGLAGVIQSACIRVIGSIGSTVKIELLPNYEYVQTFSCTGAVDSFEIQPLISQQAPTLANTILDLLLVGDIQILDITTNRI